MITRVNCRECFNNDDNTQMNQLSWPIHKLITSDPLHRDPLQSFCPALTSIKYPYSFHHVEDDDFLLQQLTRYNSFINSFLGQIPSIWASIPLTLRQRTLDERWTNLRQLLQQNIVDR